MKEVQLHGGFVALVDDGDWVMVLSAGPWHVRRHGCTAYAQRHMVLSDGRRTTQQMHTFLTGWSLVDHRNGNGLDNQRANLRQATQSQNNANRRPQTGGSSAFKGVTWRKRDKRWCAQIRLDGKTRHLGNFDDEAEAARAYDRAALELFGEFARINFPQETANV